MLDVRDIESQMERNVLRITLEHLYYIEENINKYRDEKTVLKKGANSETSKINLLFDKDRFE
jgi:hypothetical protein